MPEMFIPKRIKVGFQERDDTFTGKLGYVIYYDEKNVLRKEKSFEGWRHKNLDTVEFDNTPQNGFIFNKGMERNGHWNSGRSVIRVYDSRDFEFEISVDNLIGILMHSDVNKRDIVEQCVFAWYGTELVLLPVNSEDYMKSVAYTQKQDEILSTKDFVEGYTYQQKKSDTELIYIGHYDWYDFVDAKGEDYFKTTSTHKKKGKKHVFWDGIGFVPKTAADFSAVLHNEIHAQFAELVAKFFRTYHSQKVVGIKIVNQDDVDEQFSAHYFKYDEKSHIAHGVYTYMYYNPMNVEIGYNYHFSFEDSVIKKYNSKSYGDTKEIAKSKRDLVAKVKQIKTSDKAVLKKEISDAGFGVLHYVLANGELARMVN